MGTVVCKLFNGSGIEFHVDGCHKKEGENVSGYSSLKMKILFGNCKARDESPCRLQSSPVNCVDIWRRLCIRIAIQGTMQMLTNNEVLIHTARNSLKSLCLIFLTGTVGNSPI